MRKPTRTRKPTPIDSRRLVRENYRLVLAWSTKMHAKGWFTGWDADDIASAAYIAAVDLVDEKFDPKRGTLGTFLYSRLYSRVRYQWAADRGLKWNRDEKRWHRRFSELESFEFEPDIEP
jgi:hypothetical protein